MLVLDNIVFKRKYRFQNIQIQVSKHTYTGFKTQISVLKTQMLVLDNIKYRFRNINAGFTYLGSHIRSDETDQ